MRTLALLLILANALYFIWSQMIDTRESALDRAAPAANPAPRIVLAREAEPEIAPERPREVAEIKPPAVEPLMRSDAEAQTARSTPMACTSVGPFADLPQAAQAQSALRSAGYEPRQRMEQGELWVGYWVSVGGFGAREEAENAIRRLMDNGVTDVYLMPESEQGHIVSLGVFSDYQRAQRRAEQVRSLGFSPRIADRKRAGSVYWIDVDLREPGEALDLALFQNEVGKITRLELRACPADAA